CSYGFNNTGEYAASLRRHAEEGTLDAREIQLVLEARNDPSTNRVAGCLHDTVKAEELTQAIAEGYSITRLPPSSGRSRAAMPTAARDSSLPALAWRGDSRMRPGGSAGT